MRSFWVFVILMSIMFGWFGAGAVSHPAQAVIADVSWPNCDIYLAPAGNGIVGINGGLALRPNPCLAQEALNYKKLSVYVNTGYPGPLVARNFQTGPKDCATNDKACRAYNYGYNSGVYDIKYSLMSGVVAKHWWLDVETENSWDKDPVVNRAALAGTLDALGRLAGRDNLGLYSYPGQWDQLTNHWRNGYPQWVATGSTKLSDAKDACRDGGFSGGPIVLAQYTPDLDANVVCASLRPAAL